VNPFLIIFGCFFGAIDILVAALTFFSIEAAGKNKSLKSSALLGAASVLKLYPALIVPLLLIHFKGANRNRWAIYYLAVLVSVTTAAWFLWGNSSFAPFTRIPLYEPELLSLPAFLHNFINADGSYINLVYAGIFFGAWLTALGFCIIRNVELFLSALIIFSVGLATFKIGHLQYLGIISFLLLFQVLRSKQQNQKRELYLAVGFYLWIQAVIIWYFYSELLPTITPTVRTWVGLFHFVFVCVFAIFSLRAKRREQRIAAQNTA
jgi:hypothetical protein